MLATEMHILAIDLGTSGPKVALVNPAGRIAEMAFEPVQLHLSPDGGAEQDPEDWWASIVRAVRRVLGGGVPASSVRAVVCTGQWSGTVAVSEQGRALGRAIIWMDTRGATDIERYNAGLRVAGYNVRKLIRSVRLTGGTPAHSGKDPLAHILWLRRARPEIYAEARWFLEPKDALNLRLTGVAAASVDSITLHWLTDNRDLARVRYDPTLLAWSGIDPTRLPPLCRSIDVLGPLTEEAASALGLSREVQVIAGTPDVQSAALGSGAIGDFEAHLYIGTSSWLSCHVPFKKTSLQSNMASLPSAIPGRYFVATEQEVAGKALDYLLGTVLYPDDSLAIGPKPEDIYARIEQLVNGVPPGAGRVIFAPWLVGERTPVEDPCLRGALFNLSLGTTRAEIVRAVLEGVAYNTRWLREAVEQFIGRKLGSIAAIGGGARSSAWCQVMADVLDRPVQRVQDPLLANLRGVALLGAVGMGWIRLEDLHGAVPIERVFEPRAEHRERYDDMYAGFRTLHRQCRTLFTRLNRPR